MKPTSFRGLVLVILLASTTSLRAAASVDDVATLFRSAYNAAQFERITSICNADMQKDLPPAKLSAFLKSTRANGSDEGAG